MIAPATVKTPKRLGERLMMKTRYMIRQYHQLKKITKERNEIYAEDTDRFGWSVGWYETIRETLERWREETPEDGKIVMEIFGIGNERIARTAQAVSMRHHYSVSTVYQVRKSFIIEVTIIAATRGLLNIK